MRTFFVYILTALLLLFVVESKNHTVDVRYPTAHTATKSASKKIIDISKKKSIQHSFISFDSYDPDYNLDLNVDNNSLQLLSCIGIAFLLTWLILYHKKQGILVIHAYQLHVKTYILIQSLRL